MQCKGGKCAGSFAARTAAKAGGSKSQLICVLPPNITKAEQSRPKLSLAQNQKLKGRSGSRAASCDVMP